MFIGIETGFPKIILLSKVNLYLMNTMYIFLTILIKQFLSPDLDYNRKKNSIRKITNRQGCISPMRKIITLTGTLIQGTFRLDRVGEIYDNEESFPKLGKTQLKNLIYIVLHECFKFILIYYTTQVEKEIIWRRFP